ncbi:hypothetical protein L1887_00315 [Cichorium endivia]|nr:hypothetical protein L1887_00315 [Cichorium endivia]
MFVQNEMKGFIVKERLELMYQYKFLPVEEKKLIRHNLCIYICLMSFLLKRCTSYIRYIYYNQHHVQVALAH